MTIETVVLPAKRTQLVCIFIDLHFMTSLLVIENTYKFQPLLLALQSICTVTIWKSIIGALLIDHKSTWVIVLTMNWESKGFSLYPLMLLSKRLFKLEKNFDILRICFMILLAVNGQTNWYVIYFDWSFPVIFSEAVISKTEL